MHIRKALVGMLAGTAVALGAAAVPAQAAPTDSTAILAPAAGGTAPACVTRDVAQTSQGFWVYLENTCTQTMRVQVIVNNAPSSSCMTMGEGVTAAWFSPGTDGSYARTAVC